MRTLSPNLDRIGAALKALRQTHDQDPEDKVSLGAKCLAVLIHQLNEDGLPQEDLQPLVDLEATLRDRRAVSQPDGAVERRRGGAPSEVLLARVSAVIDLLVKSGYEEGEAAQMLMRRMLATGVSAPLKGGDPRGWKRLLAWRADISHGIGSVEAQDEYQAFTRQLDAIPPGERLAQALDQHLWNCRRKPR